MRRREKASKNAWGIPGGEKLNVHVYGTGDAAEILDIPIWQLRNFLDGPAYQLPIFDQIGEGKGSRRMFSREGLYRIATARVLVRDGLKPNFVGTVLSHLEEAEFQELDERGNHVRPGIVLERTAKGSQVSFFPSGKPPQIKGGRFGPYYVLDLGWIMDEINARIRERQARGTEKK